MLERIKRVFTSKKNEFAHREHLFPYDCELFQKVDKLRGMYDVDEEMKVYVGHYYWKDIPSIWNGRSLNESLTKFEKTNEIKLKGSRIIYDKNDEYRFDIEF